MKGLRTATAALALMGVVGTAEAQTLWSQYSGYWEVYAHRTPTGTIYCGIETVGLDGGTLIVKLYRDSRLELFVGNPAWDLPVGEISSGLVAVGEYQRYHDFKVLSPQVIASTLDWEFLVPFALESRLYLAWTYREWELFLDGSYRGVELLFECGQNYLHPGGANPF